MPPLRAFSLDFYNDGGAQKTIMMAPLECQEVSGYDHSHTNYTAISQTERQIARKKPLDYGGNPDHVTASVTVEVPCHTQKDCVTVR